MFKVDVASIVAIRYTLRQLTDEEGVLLNDVLVKQILVKPSKIVYNE